MQRKARALGNLRPRGVRLGRFKTESIWPRGPWKNIDEVDYATLEWVDWYNNRRLLGPIGDIPPAEYEAAYYERENGRAIAA